MLHFEAVESSLTKSYYSLLTALQVEHMHSQEKALRLNVYMLHCMTWRLSVAVCTRIRRLGLIAT